MGALFFKKGTDKFSNLAVKNLKEINVTDIDGASQPLGNYLDGKKATIFVNTASGCGLTSNHFRQLVELYDKYKGEGLEILGFPCNQFMGQESKCELDIKNYARNKFKVEFPLFSKIEVNGPQTHEVYLYLKKNTKEFDEGNGKLKNIPWNFAKFLVDSNGQVVKYYDPKTDPDKMIPEIEKILH